jgi:8-oxo-dGTP pyrophosphatase MutT (NUDIX family)
MIKEFRKPLNEYVFSFPAGIIEKKDKTPLDAYVREIEEELGGSIKNIEYCQKILCLYVQELLMKVIIMQ